MERMAGKAIRRSTNADRRSASRWIAVAIATVTMLVLTTGAAAGAQIGSCQTLSAAGTYTLTSDLEAGGGDCLTIAADDVTIQGAGHLINDSDAAVFHENGNDALEVVDLRIAHASDGLEMDVGSDAVLRNVRTNTTVSDGVEADGSNGLTVIDSNLTVSSDGIDYDEGGGEVRVENSELLGDGGGDAIDLDGTITGATIIVVGSTLGQSSDGIDAGCCGTPLMQDSTVMIEGNTLRNISSDGMEFDDVESSDVTIRNNVFQRSDYSDLVETDDFMNSSLRIGGNRANTSGDGFDLDEFDPNSHVAVTGNRLHADDDAVEVDDIEHDSTGVISGNTITTDTSGCCNDGILNTDVLHHSSLRIEDNAIDVGGDGIESDDYENASVRVERNTVNSSEDMGIEMDGHDGPHATVVVAGNDVVSEDEALEYEDLEDDSTGRISGNTLVSGTDYGMEIDDVGENSTLSVLDNDVEAEDEALDYTDLYPNSSLTITRNRFFSEIDEGGEIDDFDNGAPVEAEIARNTFETNDSSEEAVEMDWIEDGPVLMRYNEFRGGDVALNVGSSSNTARFEVEDNAFFAATFGVENDNTTAGAIVDARDNYWNASDGPGSTGSLEDPVTATLANGSGSNVSAGPTAGVSNVRFDPFLSTNPLQGGGDLNEMPVAAFEVAPAEPTAGDTVTFNASDSRDPDGDVRSYFWEFDGPGGVTVGDGEEATTTVDSEGWLEASLIVRDDDGDTASADRTLSIASVEEERQQTIPAENVTQNETAVQQTEEETRDGVAESDGSRADDGGDGGPDDTEEVASPDGGDGAGGEGSGGGADGGDGGDGGSGTAPVVLGVIAVVGAVAAAVLFLRG